ncbi:glutaredoxin family protein [Glutamicibacter nicotianae]|uniref:glutaredoxin family protein n=1 Tax=Glutamicibacter nicotianae TaxID=37929 RepID=UPI00307A31DE
MDSRLIVKVFGHEDCGQCTMTTKQLTKAGIIHTYVDLDLPEHQEVYKQLKARGLMRAPVVELGDETWTGFLPMKFPGAKQIQEAQACDCKVVSRLAQEEFFADHLSIAPDLSEHEREQMQDEVSWAIDLLPPIHAADEHDEYTSLLNETLGRLQVVCGQERKLAS